MPNINYEEDTRHEATERTLYNLKSVMLKQDDFGMKKYSTPLHHSLPYAWDEMMDEEIADFLKYHQCEKDRKAHVVQLLEAALRVEDNTAYIQSALDLLTITGTGKEK